MKNIKKVKDLLGTLDWLFSTNNFKREIILNDEDVDQKPLAEVTYDETYQYMTVRLFPAFFACTEDEQRKCILHEFCHSITLKSKLLLQDLLDGRLVTPEEIRRTNERETSIIENILHGLLLGKLSYANDGYRKYLKKQK